MEENARNNASREISLGVDLDVTASDRMNSNRGVGENKSPLLNIRNPSQDSISHLQMYTSDKIGE